MVGGRDRALGVGEAGSRQRHTCGQEPCCFPGATRPPGPGLLGFEGPVPRELRGSRLGALMNAAPATAVPCQPCCQGRARRTVSGREATGAGPGARQQIPCPSRHRPRRWQFISLISISTLSLRPRVTHRKLLEGNWPSFLEAKGASPTLPAEELTPDSGGTRLSPRGRRRGWGGMGPAPAPYQEHLGSVTAP